MIGELEKRFEHLWQSDPNPPDPFVFFDEGGSTDADLLMRLILVDQRFRWNTASPLSVEDYIRKAPDLSSADQKLRLIIGEFQSRMQCGGVPHIDEYLSRFSDIEETLRGKLSGLSDRTELIGDSSSMMTQTSVLSLKAPVYLGRYRLERVLGEGAFGQVYLALDTQLCRQVAIKRPKPGVFLSPEDAEAYLLEARIVAGLDHPNIVPVYDVGRDENGAVYVVSKFISGRTLATRASQDRLTAWQLAGFIATVSEALDHAHQKRLIHRDVKPQNILIEEPGDMVYVADFGLAIDENEFLRSGRVAGTPSYMSPEQVRGEGHRLDGRSDIFSLGVILYELLTGIHPFRVDNRAELIDRIMNMTPHPLRGLDRAIPVELERITLRALAKRASDRYLRAADLAHDIRHWQNDPNRVLDGDFKIVPKGLRSFDAKDANFFLQMLPGPRDREGLPSSVAFWKNRVESNDSDETFSVGLIYGPSGCGKSSLVKAGLLPRLDSHVQSVYVEATPQETELRLVKSLRKRFPDLASDWDLVEILRQLRLQTHQSSQKILIVLDQFEQWLHIQRDLASAELTRALRHCDGPGVQAIIMVRDDFAMSAARFMNALDIPIVQGQNFATVDLFDVEHTECLLEKFGQAFGKLPISDGKISDEQHQFIQRLASGLSQDGKVVSVRLALFADMVKDKPWVPATLTEVGGTEGIGVNFLEEKFNSRSANPRHRQHELAARNVLKSLLPEAGTTIKGNMRSHYMLLHTSGYQGRPAEFAELLQILDGELRLITPTDPEGTTIRPSPQESASSESPCQREEYFQLTHDYLVRSLRDWLTRKQRETLRGRAELQLAESAAHWNSNPERRRLPTALEYVSIRLLTDRSKWSAGEARMMRRADRFYTTSGLLVVGLLMCFMLSGKAFLGFFHEQQKRTQALGLIEALVQADTDQVAQILPRLEPLRPWVDPVLTERLATAKPDSREELHLRFASANYDSEVLSFLFRRLLNCSAGEFRTIRDQLQPYRSELIDKLWYELNDRKGGEQGVLQAAGALASYDASNEAWSSVSQSVSEALVRSNPVDLGNWVEALEPIGKNLVPKLIAIQAAPKNVSQSDSIVSIGSATESNLSRSDLWSSSSYQTSDTRRNTAAHLLSLFLTDDLSGLLDLLLKAEPEHFNIFFPKIADHGSAAVEQLEKKLDRFENLGTQRQTFSDPEPSIVEKIQHAKGIVSERFAICQVLPLAEVSEVCEGLAMAGYHPRRLRPYAHGNKLYAAVVWDRGGAKFKVQVGLTSQQAIEQSSELKKANMFPMDASGYFEGETTDQANIRYAVVWAKVGTDLVAGEIPLVESEMHLGVPESKFNAAQQGYGTPGLFPVSFSRLVDVHSRDFYTIVEAKLPESFSSNIRLSDIDEGLENLEGEDRSRSCIDVSVTERHFDYTPLELRLSKASEKLTASPSDQLARLERIQAAYHLGRIDEALADCNWLRGIGGDPKTPPLRVSSLLTSKLSLYRALALARTKQPQEAEKELELLRRSPQGSDLLVGAESLVACYTGDYPRALNILKPIQAKTEVKWHELSLVAWAYAEMGAYFEETDEQKSDYCWEVAAGFIDLAARLSPSSNAIDFLKSHPFFIHRINHPRFVQLLRQLSGKAAEMCYTGCWLLHNERIRPYSTRHLHDLNPDELIKYVEELAANGYRPLGLSVATHPSLDELSTASLWLPLHEAGTMDGEVARERANAALALMRLNATDRVWKYFVHSEDPIIRSYIMNRCLQQGIDPDRLAERLFHEKQPSARRALILAIGGCYNREAPLSGRLLQWLAEAYEFDPDAGIHSAAEWALRQSGFADLIVEMDRRLMRSANVVRRSWYCSSNGQTMVILPDASGVPATFDYRFAIATSELGSVRSQESNIQNGWPTGTRNLFGAISYCTSLSQSEGVPVNQLCFSAGKNDSLPNDYATRIGYRMPSLEEWQYACRSGSLARRFYGDSAALLENYAWFFGNSQNELHASKLLKPNDFGLFDCLGNHNEHVFGKSVQTVPSILYSFDPTDSGFLVGSNFQDSSYELDTNAVFVPGPIFNSSTNAIRLARTLPDPSKFQNSLDLAEFFLTVDGDMYRYLLPDMVDDRVTSLKSFEQILAREIKSQWQDVAIPNSWKNIDAATMKSIEQANGIVHDRFAFVQTMPLDEIHRTSDEMRQAGYRPIRLRPYESDGHILVAAVWKRDGKPFQLESNLTKLDLVERANQTLRDGLQPTDVAAYRIDSGTDSNAAEEDSVRFAVLWSAAPSEEEHAFEVELTNQQLNETNQKFNAQSFNLTTLQVRFDREGERRFCATWSKLGPKSDHLTTYSGWERIDHPMWDISAADVGPRKLPDPLQVYRDRIVRLSELDLSPESESANPLLRKDRAVANFYLGKYEAALDDLEYLRKFGTNENIILRIRVIALARMGRSDEARSAYEEYSKTNAPPVYLKSNEIQLVGLMGDTGQAAKLLKEASAEYEGSSSDLYRLACTAALFADPSTESPTAARRVTPEQFAHAAITLLKRSVANGFRSATTIMNSPELIHLHSDQRFLDILDQIDVPGYFAGLWRADPNFESRLLLANSPNELVAKSQDLIDDGFRPISIATNQSYASIWIRPVIDSAAQNKLDEAKSTIAYTLFHPEFYDAEVIEKIWPLFANQSDPSVQTRILSLMTEGIDPILLIDELFETRESEIRFGLLQAIHRLAVAGLIPVDRRSPLIDFALDRYKDDTDPGVHAAATKLLQTLGRTDLIASAKKGFALGRVNGERNWFLTKTGQQTMAIIPAGTFFMGSPVHESGHSYLERRHFRRIDSDFAMAATEVTVEQFGQFNSNVARNGASDSSEAARPVSVTWYQAVEFCNWLSEKEGIPKSEWCYEPNSAGRYEDGMKIKVNHTRLAGYRLPTEAEWEYACRAGSQTATYFGDSSTFVPQYSVTRESAQSAPIPVASLRPNRFGLFDTLGNLQEWCADSYFSYNLGPNANTNDRPAQVVLNTNIKIARGGAFDVEAQFARAAARKSISLTTTVRNVGFRVAKTMK